MTKQNKEVGFTLPEHAEQTLLEELLEDQQRLTAVDQFVQDHEHGEYPAQAKYYRNLIPFDKPQAGQQYAFEVDLDRCSGCTACVSACHSMNGLDDNETWRSVGLLFSQDWQRPYQQTVTTACHHCLDPGCLTGCPVLAYDKDPATGIVRHLDDQCIGCQYCIMKCPYEVPRFSKARGIVRKCDMCSNRLAVGEAPACVQACPTEAIRIVVANTAQVSELAEGGRFLPAAPSPEYTKPSTQYKSSRTLPEGLLAGDHSRMSAADPHFPLVFMLVLSQLAVGTSIAAFLTRPSIPLLLIAAAAGAAAPAVAALHLGKPLKAWRAFLGWRTSWFSREVIVFGAFVPISIGALAGSWAGSEALSQVAGVLASTIGLAGVACSAMIYVDTHREFWKASQCFGKFFGTTALLGAAILLAVQSLSASGSSTLVIAALLVIAATAFKQAVELRIFRSFVSKNRVVLEPLNKTARLLVDELGAITRLREGCAVFGGFICPLLTIMLFVSGNSAWHTFGVATLVLSLAGELLERYLFFTAVVTVRMPGRMAA